MNSLTDNIDLRPNEFRLFKELIYRHAGICLSERKQTLVQSRLKKRLRTLAMKSYREYYDYICESSHRQEFQECLNAITTNETYFFRHKNHWDFVMQTVLPELREASPGGGTVRVWSCASSTGEEPYSAAIALYDQLPPPQGWRIEIDATDINREVLDRAGEGIYNDYAVQKLTPACLARYFDRNGEQFRLREEVKRLVRFRLHNLLQPAGVTTYNLIFLRNVMIYFDDASKRTVMRHVTDRLKPGGYLFLGGAETLAACQEAYDYAQPTIYRKK